MCVIALDPGNSTGWVFRAVDGSLVGGTVGEDHLQVYMLLENWRPQIVIYETFQLYPGKAQQLSWNSFYPVEVIGVIKLWVMRHPEVRLVGLQPSVKKFALGNNELDLWKTVEKLDQVATEHLRDAVRLLRYYERNIQK